MASEELERSLRAEVEKHLASRLVEMQQELAQLQSKFSDEIARLQSAVSGEISSLTERAASASTASEEMDLAITDHIRAAHKQGIQEAAAESSATQEGSSLAILKAAIYDIGQQGSQAAILKSLVDHSGSFAPRVAFFIIKNDHLIGWRARGLEGTVGDQAVKDIHIPLLSETVLGEAANTQATWSGQAGGHGGDHRLLGALGENPPGHSVAIPLVARGRSVAVLYADSADLGAESINLEALEALVRVTGMAVELLAGPPASANPAAPAIQHDINETYRELTAQSSTIEETPEAESYDASMAPEPATSYAADTAYAAYDATVAPEEAYGSPVAEPEVETAEVADTWSSEPAAAEAAVVETAEATDAWVAEPAPETEPTEAWVADPEPITYEADEPESFEAQPIAETPVYAAPPQPEPVAEEAPRTRSWSRDTELPIEVAEDDRKVHNDARRFARLLVSEIKLYNEQKVKEGR
ncbi:MAG: hypothetical protein ABIZ95_11790, partial [Pyrinomonadaceae bacterium]